MPAEQLNLINRINELRRQANFEAYESLLRVYFRLYGHELPQKDCSRTPSPESDLLFPETDL